MLLRKSIGCVVAAGLLSSCSLGKDIPTAEAQTARFHQELNAGQFDDIYTASSPDMKASTTQATFVELLAAVHRKLGNFQSGASSTWNDNVTTSGHFVTMNYTATYDRGKADENFVYRVDGDRAVLAGYHVNSNALILN